MKFAENKNSEQLSVVGFESVAGMGAKGVVDGYNLSIGNEKMMMQESVMISDEMLQSVKDEQKKGRTVSYISINGELNGYITIFDAIKPTSIDAIYALKRKGH